MAVAVAMAMASACRAARDSGDQADRGGGVSWHYVLERSILLRCMGSRQSHEHMYGCGVARYAALTELNMLSSTLSRLF